MASADARRKLQDVYGEFNGKAKVAVEKSGKIIEELNELTKGNVEAVVESGKIAAKGAETLGQEAADYSRRSFEKATATMKSFSSVKSPTAFFQLQGAFFSRDRKSVEKGESVSLMLEIGGGR